MIGTQLFYTEVKVCPILLYKGYKITLIFSRKFTHIKLTVFNKCN